jgi:hypothetical protein
MIPCLMLCIIHHPGSKALTVSAGNRAHHEASVMMRHSSSWRQVAVDVPPDRFSSKLLKIGP